MEIVKVPSINDLKVIDINMGVSYSPFMEIREALNRDFLSLYIEMRETLSGCVFQSIYGNKNRSKC